MSFYEDLAMLHIKNIVDKKVESGIERNAAVYEVKRELVKMTKPLEATGSYAEALDAMQKARGCTLDAALTALKLMVRAKYNDPAAWD